MQVHNQEVYSTETSNLVTWANQPAVVADVVALHCTRYHMSLSTVANDNTHTIKAYITHKQADTINKLINTVTARINAL